MPETWSCFASPLKFQEEQKIKNNNKPRLKTRMGVYEDE